MHLIQDLAYLMMLLMMMMVEILEGPLCNNPKQRYNPVDRRNHSPLFSALRWLLDLRRDSLKKAGIP